MRRRLIRIGLVFTQNLAYCRRVLRGIKDFAESRPEWVLLPVAPEPSAIRGLAPLAPAGLIGHMFDQSIVEAVQKFDVPYVNVCSVLREPVLPWVAADDVLVGRLAAGHLLERGFHHFAFVGHLDHYFSIAGERGYREVVEAAGFRVESYYEPQGHPFSTTGRLWSQNDEFRRWTLSLPRPVAVFASNDMWGLHLTEVCRQSGVRVPDDVAIVGVDNDDLTCSLARPSLSSVSLPAERIGIEAAKLLDRLLRGGRPPRRPRLLPPVGVVQRRSSDVLAIGDVEVAAAMRFIRDEGHRPLQIRDVVAHVPVSRRSLQRRFQRVLGRGIHEEISRVRLERASRLLTETELPMHVIAERAGFVDSKRLSVSFRQMTGQTPTAFRRAARGPGGTWGRPGE